MVVVSGNVQKNKILSLNRHTHTICIYIYIYGMTLLQLTTLKLLRDIKLQSTKNVNNVVKNVIIYSLCVIDYPHPNILIG